MILLPIPGYNYLSPIVFAIKNHVGLLQTTVYYRTWEEYYFEREPRYVRMAQFRDGLYYLILVPFPFRKQVLCSTSIHFMVVT